MRAPWTEAHQREACALTHTLVAAMVREHGVDGAPEGGATCGHEGDLRWWLRNVAKLSDARIDREVRRVRGLAEGRLVRAQHERWEVAFSTGTREGRPDDNARQRAAVVHLVVEPRHGEPTTADLALVTCPACLRRVAAAERALRMTEARYYSAEDDAEDIALQAEIVAAKAALRALGVEP